MDETPAQRSYREVMTVEPPTPDSPLQQAMLDFVFGEVWTRPVLTRRERRWITLACVGAADAPGPIEKHVYAALRSGDVELTELLEFVLHFAAYAGWPKASHLETITRAQWTRLSAERGEPAPPWPEPPFDALAAADATERLRRAGEVFAEVNRFPAPRPDTPYVQAGVLDFVFGQLWLRPGLTRRERRLGAISCAGVSDAPTAIWAHVHGALASGDLSLDEMRELVLHFSVYSGFAKGEALDQAVTEASRRLEGG